jgi:hypothetical protein
MNIQHFDASLGKAKLPFRADFYLLPDEAE